jgi:hypothetical protein
MPSEEPVMQMVAMAVILSYRHRGGRDRCFAVGRVLEGSIAVDSRCGSVTNQREVGTQ